MQQLLDAINEVARLAGQEATFPARAELLSQIDEAICRLEAAKLTVLERIDRSGEAAMDAGSTAAWLRGQTNTSPSKASREVHLARDLSDVLPAVMSALAEGSISVEHAQVCAGLRKDLPDETVRSVDASLAEAARSHTVTELRSWMQSLRHSLSPEIVVRDEQEAWERRERTAATLMYGVGVGQWTLDPVSHELVMTAIHAASPPKSGDSRTARNRRADALITISQFFLDHHGTDSMQRRAVPHVTVTTTIETLLGEPCAPAASTSLGASISGAALRRLACDSTVARVVFGPGNEVINVGRDSRTFTTAARRGLVARDKHCRWPGCSAPASWCEAHHGIHWIDDGPSDVENGILLCGRHHDRIHNRNHAVIIDINGSRTVDTLAGSAFLRGTTMIDRRKTAVLIETRAGP